MSGSAPVAGQSFPRPILFAVGGMLAMVTVVAGLSRLEGGVTEVPHSTPVLQRDLRFEDRADGGVTVRDAHDDHVVTVVTGQAGFLRATMRGLAQQRLREDLGEAPPFRLTQWADGRLTLDDLADHRHIELEAFGVTNEGVFAGLLDADAAKPRGAQP
jgi:putative photosynthetic complex assembly protein